MTLVCLERMLLSQNATIATLVGGLRSKRRTAVFCRLKTGFTAAMKSKTALVHQGSG